MGTPFAAGIFKIEVRFPENFPFAPPKIRFLTKIFHPNISLVSGYVCINILDINEWSPALSIQNVLLSICSMLEQPNPDDPVEKEVGELYKTNKFMYEQKAREYTNLYAQ